MFGAAWRRWTRELLAELRRAELMGRVIWKINCRADAVESELFAEMRDAGLYLVYMGLESGSDEGLVTLNKGVDVAQNLPAVRTLKTLGLMFEFGFMMFDPSSTFDSIRENVAFLRAITGDGSAAAVFCRMLPYDGTPIKTQLAAEGRLRGDVCNPDYDFLDDRIDALRGVDRYEQTLRSITRTSNKLLFTLVEDAVRSHESAVPLRRIEALLEPPCDRLLVRLQRARDGFVLKNQQALIHTLEERGLMRAA